MAKRNSRGARIAPHRLRRLRLQQLERRLMLAADVEGEEIEGEEEFDLFPQLLRDINQTIPNSRPLEFVQSGDKIFISADDGIHGRELFVTDGTSPPTLVKDIRRGTSDSDPQHLTDIDGVLYFVADSFGNGRELWKSDGTEAGTMLVEDIYPGSDSSNPMSLTAARMETKTRLFFTAEHPESGVELWVADEDNGASLVTDIWPGHDGTGNPNHGFPQHLTFWPQHENAENQLILPTLYFSAATEAAGRELWQTTLVGDTTLTTLVSNIFEDEFLEPNSSNPSDFAILGDHIYFAAEGGEFNEAADKVIGEGKELWRSDGTPEGTELVEDIRPGFAIPAEMENPFSSSPRDLTVHNGKIFFSAHTSAEGRELWKLSGGEEPELGFVRNIRGGSASSSPADFTSTDGFLFFTANGGQGKELWRTDGTFAETKLTRDIRPGSGTPLLFTRGYAALGSSVIFGADDGTLGPEVWISDGTEDGTQILKEIQFGRNSSNVPSGYSTIGDTVYFESSEQIWKTDGTREETKRFPLDTEATLGSFEDHFFDVGPKLFARANNLLFFAADDGENGNELWKSDGSTAGTVMVKDLAPGTSITFPESTIETPNSSNPEHLTAVGDQVFFTSGTSSRLTVTDGTAVGTQTLGNVSADELTPFLGQLFFAGERAGSGPELWMSDGTAEGTVLVHEMKEGPEGSRPEELTVVGDKLFFTAEGENGRELWVSDGTSEGTMEFDIDEESSSHPSLLTPVGNRLFFRADDGVFGPELWVSDGSEEGTVLVKDIHNLAEGAEDFLGSNPTPLANLNGELLFFADDRVNGQQLWKSDGTEEGTFAIKDIWPDSDEEEFFTGEFGSVDGLVTIFDGKVFFPANDGVNGTELWSSDGTTVGTNLFMDLVPGDDDSFPTELTVVGDKMFFAADMEHPLVPGAFGGRELWISDGTTDFTVPGFGLNTVDNQGIRPRSLRAIGGTLYFVGNDGIHGEEVFTTSIRLKADDVLFEMLARDVAYRDVLTHGGDPIERGDEIVLENLAYASPFAFTVDLVIHDETTGFDAYGLIADNTDPILLLRGTAGFLDILSDTRPDGIGVDQFDANQTEIFAWLNRVSEPNRRPSVTGHSLGGALTQFVAAGYTASGKELAQVVSFNAPGISEERAGEFVPALTERVMHYVTDGDIVSMAGEAFIEGKWRRTEFDAFNLGVKHGFPILADYTFAFDTDPDETEIRPQPIDLEFTDYDDVRWLNNPFYFHTDLEYYVYLSGIQILLNNIDALHHFRHIPGSLIFRSTTESTRQSVGEVIQAVEDQIDELLETLTCNSPEARVTAPDFDLNLLNLLEIEARDLAVSCHAGPPSEARLQGLVRLPQLNNATANFAGENYIGLSNENITFKGELSIDELPLLPGFWRLYDLSVKIDTGVIEAKGSIDLPTGLSLTAELEFLNGSFNRVKLRTPSESDPNPINQPLGATGIFLQSINGVVDHVSSADPAPISFGGGLSATGGPTISLSLPSWAGGTVSGKLIDFTADGSIDKNHLEANGTLEIIEGVAKVTGDVEVNWNQGFVASSGDLDVLDGLIEADGSFRADSSLNIDIFADATFGIPDAIPLIGGYDAVSGNFTLDYSNDSNFENDFVAAWTTFDLIGFGETNLGFRVFFDGSFGTIGAEEVAEITTPPPAGGEGEQVGGTATYEIEADTQWALFAAAWDSGATDRAIVITTPSGETITEADLASRGDIAIVTDLSTAMRRVVIVDQPEAGQWVVTVNDDTSLTNLCFHAYVHNETPTVSVQATDGLDGAPVEITVHATDPDSDAKISLYYDTDNQGFDGVRIVSDLTETDGSYSWAPNVALNGQYYIYAVIDDGINPIQLSYAGDGINVTPGPQHEMVYLPVDGGIFETFLDNNEFVVRRQGGEDLFRKLESKLLGVDIIGVQYVDDSILANLAGSSIPVSLNGGDHGHNEFSLTGSGQSMDLIQPIDLDLVNVDLINITGIGSNTLTIGPDAVMRLSPDHSSIQLRHDSDDNVDYSGNGWKVDAPVFVDGQQWHVLNNNNARIETANTLPHQNPLVASDVNFSGETSPIDALLVINFLARSQTNPVDLSAPTSFAELPEFYYDVNGSGTASPIDALQVINFIARHFVPSGEGELVSASSASDAVPIRDENHKDSRVVSAFLPATSPVAASENDGRGAGPDTVSLENTLRTEFVSVGDKSKGPATSDHFAPPDETNDPADESDGNAWELAVDDWMALEGENQSTVMAELREVAGVY